MSVASITPVTPVNLDAMIDRLNMIYNDADLVSTISSVALGKLIDKDDIARRTGKVAVNKQKLQKLLDLPKMEQRTPVWYEARQTMITASDFAQALGKGKFGTQKQFFQKKCGYEKDSFDMFKAALCWGVMFESVAADAYAYYNKCKLYEFGLLRHPTLDWVGASPDGINENGVMLEIKCPFKRKITGEIPSQYYYQMQGQLDVCDLDECDYLECEFLEYENEREFVKHFADNNHPKGVVIELHQTDSSTNSKYVYSPFDLHADRDNTIDWLHRYLAQRDMSDVAKVHYWQLFTYSVSRVYRDEQFLANDVYPDLKAVWEKVVAYKRDKDLYDLEISAPSASIIKKQESAAKMSISISTATATKNVKFDAYAFVDDN